MTQKDKVKELVGRGLHSYHTKALQQMDRIEKKNKEQNHKISILTNELDNDYLTKTEEGSVISLEHSKEGMVYIDELQGNTLVNYCTDGSKEMTLNGDIDLEGTFVTTTEGVDNGKVDVYCEGNTLVNLSNTKEVLNKNKSHYDDIYLCESSRIKPNVSYTVIYDFECNIDFTFDTCYVGYSTTTPSVMVEQFSGNRHYAKKGKNIMCFNLTIEQYNVAIEKGAKYFQIRVFIDNEKKEKQYSSKNIMLLEGDWTNKEIPPYLEGMKSVGQDDENGHKIEILSRNKNLIHSVRQCDNTLDKGVSMTMTSDNTLQMNGTTTNSNGDLDYTLHNSEQMDIYLKPNKDYVVNFEVVSGSVTPIPSNAIKITDLVTGAVEWRTVKDSNKVIESSVNPRKVSWIRLAYSQVTTFDNYKYRVQIEEGNTTTSYVKGLCNKKEILMNEPLRGLPSGYRDKFIKISGKLYIERNINEVTIDSLKGLGSVSDVITTDDITTSRVYISYETVTPLMPNIRKNEGTMDIICDKLPYKAVVPNIQQEVQMAIGKTGAGVSLRLKGANIGECETWLNKNPLKIAYALATPIYELVEVDSILNTYNDTTHISNNSIIPCTMKIKNSGYNAIIKPSTLYTIALDTNKSGTIGMNLGGTKGTTTNNVLKLTTPATITDDSLRLHGKGIKGSKVRLLEGDKTNWIPSHFEGVKSSFEEKLQDDGTYKIEILSNNKNLFDINKYNTNDKWYNVGWGQHNVQFENGVFQFKMYNGCQNYYIDFPFNLNEQYTIKFKARLVSSTASSGQIKISKYFTTDRYDSSELTGSVAPNGDWVEYTKHFKPKYRQIGFNCFISPEGKEHEGYWYIKDIQISKDNSSFINHKSNKIQFSSIEPLRSVSDIKDRFVFKDNKLVIERNCITKDLTRSMSWSLNATGVSTNHTQFVCRILPTWNCSGKEEQIICDTKPTKYTNGGNDSIWIYDKTTIVVQMRYDLIKTKEEFLLWIDKEQPKIVLPLAEPTYEEIPFELQKIILEGYENGTLFFDTNIPPTSTVTYAGETPIVKSVKLNKTEVLNNTNDINDNIIPYLMDMDYRVICLQLESNIEGISMARLFGGAYEMLKRDIQSNRLSKEEYGYRLIDYFNAGKLTEEEVRELEDLK